MERNRNFLITDDERSRSATALFAPRKDGHVTRKLINQPGSLELIEVGDKRNEKERPPSESSSRSWSRASVGSVPPRTDSSLSRRTMTPTKQISLQAVKRKEESSDLFVDNVDIDLDSIGFDGSRQRRKKISDDDGFRPLSENSFLEDELITNDSGVKQDFGSSSKTIQSASHVGGNDTHFYPEKASENHTEDIVKKGGVSAHEESSYKQDENREEESSSDSDDDEDEEEKVKLKAPNELLMEFVDCLMKKDFPNAGKLCKMVLLYEPENPEALKFKPLIEEKMKLDAEAAAAGEEEGDSDDDDDDDDDDSGDDDSDDDDDDDSSSSDEDSSEEENQDGANNPISSENIPSTSSQSQLSKDIKGANSNRAWKPAS